VVTRAWAPDAGELVWLTFDPQAGKEQARRRPTLILSPAVYNRRSGLALACPITSNAKGYPFEVALPEDLAVAGVILADHVNYGQKEVGGPWVRLWIYLCPGQGAFKPFRIDSGLVQHPSRFPFCRGQDPIGDPGIVGDSKHNNRTRGGRFAGCRQAERADEESN
jgi:mRNA-degrading endonuclease toxin of MazEF toxin-antitoxin module